MIQVGIIGVGLIGGSLGMALRGVRKLGRRKYRVVGWGRNPAKLAKAKRLGALDHFSTAAEEVLKNSDIVVVCVPVQKILPISAKILPIVKPSAILTDVGSVKKSIVRGMAALLRKYKGVSFVGAHPLAGSEKAGINFAKKKLFVGATVVITPDAAGPSSLQKVKNLWGDVGAKTILLKASTHDHLLAVTSHLPHLLAFSLFSLAQNQFRKTRVIKSLVAGSFRDMTRIVGSDPEIWAGIINHNRLELRAQARQFHRLMNIFLNFPPQHLLNELSRLSSQKLRWSK